MTEFWYADTRTHMLLFVKPITKKKRTSMRIIYNSSPWEAAGSEEEEAVVAVAALAHAAADFSVASLLAALALRRSNDSFSAFSAASWSSLYVLLFVDDAF